MTNSDHGLWKWVGLLAAIGCLGASGAAPEASEPPSWVAENLLSVTVFAAVVVGLLGWAIAVVHRRVAQRRADEEQAAMRLEAQATALIATHEAAAQPPRPTDTTPREEQPLPAQPGGKPTAPAGLTPEPTDSLEAVFTKLRAGGLFAGLEGSLYLSDGHSEGKIVSLTNGKTAVVLPRLESAEFLARQLKRFDLCIIPLGGDQTCVISSLGAFIADHFSV